MKKKTGKLSLRKLTITQLSEVAGGYYNTAAPTLCKCGGSYNADCSGSCNSCTSQPCCKY